MLLILILSSGWATSFSNSIMVAAGKHYVSFEDRNGPAHGFLHGVMRPGEAMQNAIGYIPCNQSSSIILLNEKELFDVTTVSIIACSVDMMGIA